MWLFKLILLLLLIASWIPKDGKAQFDSSPILSIEFENEEQEEEEEGEVLAA